MYINYIIEIQIYISLVSDYFLGFRDIGSTQVINRIRTISYFSVRFFDSCPCLLFLLGLLKQRIYFLVLLKSQSSGYCENSVSVHYNRMIL